MSAPPRWPLVLSIALAGLLVLGSLVIVAPRASAGAAIVFSEGFESGSIAPKWTNNDTNALSGLDFWGASSYRPHSGNFSAWCAQVGNQSSGPYAGQNNSAVHQYDDNMQAELAINLTVNGYASLTLSFWYWVRTENGGGDWLQAIYDAGGVQTVIFQQGGSSGNAWQPANLSVPNNIDRLIFRFHSDSANHGFEGAYVDDIVLFGIENVPPTSRVLPLPRYSNQDPAPIPFTATDNANASGVAYVELLYRLGNSGPFHQYNTTMNRRGQYAFSPIEFSVSATLGDGTYEFYTIAVDNAGNVEAAPVTPDANMTIDTTPPVLTINDPAAGALLNRSSVTVAWQSFDNLSGLDHYDTNLDGAAFQRNGVAGTQSFGGLSEGAHTVRVRAWDKAGNLAEAAVAFMVDTGAPVILISSPSNGEYVHTADATFTWTSFDNTTGIDHYVIWLDDGTSYLLPASNVRYTVTAIAEGAHTFHVTAVDKAGNVATATVAFSVDRNPFSLTGPYGGLPLFLLLGALLVALLLLLLWWRRRKEPQPGEPEAHLAAPGTTGPGPQPGPEPGSGKTPPTG